MTKEDFFGGVSKPVNESLAKLFIQLGIIEQTGHGIRDVLKVYDESIFTFMDNFIRVEIPYTRPDYTDTWEHEDEMRRNGSYYDKSDIIFFDDDVKGNKSGTVNAEGGTVNAEGGTVNAEGGTVNAEGGTVNNESGTVNNESGTVNNESGTVNNESGTVNNESGTVKDTGSSKLSYNVDELDKRILVAIELNNTYSADVLAELTSTSLRTVRRALKRLADGGYIMREGSDKNGHWIILKKK